jgi:hypothetical protein
VVLAAVEQDQGATTQMELQDLLIPAVVVVVEMPLIEWAVLVVQAL